MPEGGEIWSIVLLGGGDMGLRMKGISPYLSRTPEYWFDPGGRWSLPTTR